MVNLTTVITFFPFTFFSQKNKNIITFNRKIMLFCDPSKTLINLLFNDNDIFWFVLG